MCVCPVMSVCVFVRVLVCVYKFLALASTEFGVPLEHHDGNLCLVALSKWSSP